MTGLNNPKIYASINPIPLTFEEFGNKLNILQSDYVNGKNCECTVEKDVSTMTQQESTSEIKKNDFYGYLNRMDKEITFSINTIQTIQQIQSRLNDHMDSYVRLLESIRPEQSGGTNVPIVQTELLQPNIPIVQGIVVQPNQTVPSRTLKPVQIKVFPSTKINIPKEFTTINDYKKFMELVYDALIHQYTNLLQVLSQLNDPHLNKMIDKSQPKGITNYSALKEQIDLASEELSPLYFRHLSEFVHLLASESDGLFQYYLYVIKWLYASWKINTYHILTKLLKDYTDKVEKEESTLKQKKEKKEKEKSEIEHSTQLINGSINVEDKFNEKNPTFSKELEQLEETLNEHKQVIERINTFIGEHYSGFEDPNFKVYKDKDEFKQKMDTFGYVQLYKNLKLKETSMNETTSHVSLTHDKIRETIANAMRDQAAHQAHMRNQGSITNISKGGRKKRTRKWYKFQRKAIRNTMKYLKYREKKG